MLCIVIKVDYSIYCNTSGYTHTITLYVPDPDWLTTKAIADDNTIKCIDSIEFTSNYYFPDPTLISCEWVRNPDDSSTVITANKENSDDESSDNDSDDDTDEGDGDDELDTILHYIKNMSDDELDNQITITYDSHWDCYCKTQRVCGCGCDPLHDGWA